MIVGSVVLVVAAGVLLGFGLVFLDEPLLYSSIGVSALAGLALVVGVRRLASLRASAPAITVRPGGATLRLGSAAVRPESTAPADLSGRSQAVTGRAAPRPIGRATPRPVGRATVNPLTTPAEVEPAEQTLTEDEAARLASLQAEVVVVDAHPRFHLAECPHVPGPEPERLPVAEAVELGFTPCGQCRPATDLLRGDRGA